MTATLADMHTHSRHSPDSTCDMEAMCLSQLEKGTRIFAVTDHFDGFAFEERDLFTPIKQSYDEVMRLRERYGDRCLLLAGVEIGEGFWHAEPYRQIRDLLPYDVIIGSVHCVKHPTHSEPYSMIDFSAFDEREIAAYLDRYFDDLITTVEQIDFDILAHLNCPLRYINGKYRRAATLEAFQGKIRTVLSRVIERGLALEVNTSGFLSLGEPMPNASILQTYFDMGGRRVTLGSDAHVSEHASAGFARAVSLLKEVGFDEICRFEQRKVNTVRI